MKTSRNAQMPDREKYTANGGKNGSDEIGDKEATPVTPFDFFRAMRLALRIISYAMAGGIVFIFFYSLQGSTWSARWTNLSVGALVAAATAILGVFLGFLFGIPRTFQGEDTQSMPGADVDASERRMQISYRANTNLEQISDWLTKILVGVGLTQLASIPTKFASLNTHISGALTDTPKPEVMVGATLVYFCICGFLFGYLWTRLYFAGALRAADMQALLQRVAKADDKAEKLEAQAMRDARALSLVREQLDPQSDPIDQDQLNKALGEASVPVKSTVFWQAYELRRRTWKDNATKGDMERTIPIFKALIEDDERDEYHMNHGQLGFALKDKRQPDFLAAEQELTRAIQLRGNWRERGWVIYEFARAVARIGRRGEVSNEAKKQLDESIRSDLIVAAKVPNMLALMEKDSTVAGWLKEHHLTVRKLATSAPRS